MARRIVRRRVRKRKVIGRSRTRRHNDQRVRRPSILLPQVAEHDIPANTAANWQSMFGCRTWNGRYFEFFKTGFDHAMTDGCVVSVGSSEHVVNVLNMQRDTRFIHVIAEEPLQGFYDRVRALYGKLPNVLRQFCHGQTDKIAFLVLGQYCDAADVGDVLDHLSLHLRPGTVLSVPRALAASFWDWTLNGGREIYALHRYRVDIALIMLAN